MGKEVKKDRGEKSATRIYEETKRQIGQISLILPCLRDDGQNDALVQMDPQLLQWYRHKAIQVN